MFNAFLIIIIAALFYLLGKAADLIAASVRAAAGSRAAGVFLFGVVLGLITSLPELMVAINSFVGGVPLLSIGNLLGSTVVLFGLVLGSSVFLGGRVTLDVDAVSLAAAFGYILVSIAISLDGAFNTWDGFILLVGYLALLWFFYRRQHHPGDGKDGPRAGNGRHYFLALAGAVAVIILADVIVRLVMMLTRGYHLSAFVTGLVALSIGTNLPELTIAFRSNRAGVGDLSLGGITGSAVTNMLIIGLFSSIRSIPVRLGAPYYLMLLTIFLLFVSVLLFRRECLCMSRLHGGVMLFLYAIFVAVQAAMWTQG